MKKTIIISLLVVAMVASMAIVFAGCDFDGEDEFTIGAVYITSQNEDTGYTYAHHSGIKKAMETLGLKDSQLIIEDNIPDTDMDATRTAIDNLVGKGCDMIIGISYGYMDAMEEAAEKYPDVIFTHATGYKSNDTNFNNYFGRIYQARYLAGIAAGLKAKEINNNKIGYVAAFTTATAETASGINAFAMGAQSVYPEAEVYAKSLGTWGDIDLERKTADALLDLGCGVISQHCDSAQPQIAAQDRGAFGCGYNSDMTKDAPKAHLTATVWHWDVYYTTAIKEAMSGKENFMEKVGKVYYKGLADGLVGVSALSDNCADGTQEAIDAVTKLIINGEWDVFSGVKLSIAADGTITKTDAALKTNAGVVIVEAGGASVDDSVITGTMNYLVEGVKEVS